MPECHFPGDVTDYLCSIFTDVCHLTLYTYISPWLNTHAVTICIYRRKTCGELVCIIFFLEGILNLRYILKANDDK